MDDIQNLIHQINKEKERLISQGIKVELWVDRGRLEGRATTIHFQTTDKPRLVGS